MIGLGLGLTSVRPGSGGPIPSAGKAFHVDATKITGIATSATIPAASIPELSGSGVTFSFPAVDHQPQYQPSVGTPAMPAMYWRNAPGGSATVRMDLANIPGLNLSAITMIWVLQPVLTGDQFIASLIGSNAGITISGTQWTTRDQSNVQENFGVAPVAGTRVIYGMRGNADGGSNAGGLDQWLNGRQLFQHRDSGSNLWLAQAVTSAYLGTQVSGVDNSNWNGYTHEGIVWNRILSDAEMASSMASLATKWGPTLTAQTKQVVWDGNSLSIGVFGGIGCLPRLRATLPTDTRLLSYGISGVQTPSLTSSATRVDARYSASAYTRNVCGVWEITNHLAVPAGTVTGAQAYAAIVAYCQARQAAGWKVVVGTCIARNNVGLYAGFEADRLACNALIRANWATFADALADVGNDALFDAPADTANTTYYNADLTHLTSTGYTYAIDNYWQPAFAGLLA